MARSEKQPLENAEEIIERFGGIRPMASKIDVAVTTIQGWKKRGVIPANRRGNILSSAEEHDVDLSGLIEGIAAPANQDIPQDSQPSEDEQPEDKPEEAEVQDSESEEAESEEDEAESGEEELEAQEETAETEDEGDEEDEGEQEIRVNTPPELKTRAQQQQEQQSDFTEIAIESEKRAVTKSAVVTFAVVLLVLAAVVMILMPKMEQVEHHSQRITSLEGEVDMVKEEQTSFKGLVPRDWNKQLEDLKQQVAKAGEAAAPAIQTVRDASAEFIEQNAGAMQERVAELESYVSEITQSTSVSGFLDRIGEMSNSLIGQQTLDQSMLDLNSIYASLGTNVSTEQLNTYLDQARGQSAALGETFENVPQSDLQAAAMLLTMTQMRSSLKRESKPFDDDLQLLMSMVSEDNIELRASLDKLAPHAEQGILTPSGLSNEFRALTGDVIEASLKGEEVSLLEKAQARMNNLLAIEKDGELVSGTQTQATVNKAQKQIEQGNVEQAVELLNDNLSASELAPLKEWINKAEGFIGSRDAVKMIEDLINMNTGSSYLGGADFLGEDRVQKHKY